MAALINVDNIAIHCSATRPAQECNAETIRQWHKARGWDDIGYHTVICRNGDVEYGRALNVRGAHVKGHNNHSIGVCLVGGLDSQGTPTSNYTDEQWASLYQVIRAYVLLFPLARVVGHRDFDGVTKECPCFDVPAWYSRTDIDHHRIDTDNTC